ETWKDGWANQFSVKRTAGIAVTPFTITPLRSPYPKEGHGTRISGELVRGELDLRAVRDLIGSKFVADPTFKIYLNNEAVELTDIEHLSDVQEISIPEFGTVMVRCFDSKKTGRTSKQHGVAWWVN